MSARIKWGNVLIRAREIVLTYGTLVTLRQLFYRLVSEQVLPNTQVAYKHLSSVTAEARRAGDFPDLIDRGRRVHRTPSWDTPQDVLDVVANEYRRDRTDGQPWSIYLAVEKAGIVEQLSDWFDHLGVPILALGGYSSQSYIDVVAAEARAAGRPAVLLYGGDFDYSGEDILRDFIKRTDCWDKVVQVALTADQVTTYGLVPNPGKDNDPRAKEFARRHGTNVQVELDALDPNDLKVLYTDAISDFWDTSAYADVVAEERDDRARLRDLAQRWGTA